MNALLIRFSLAMVLGLTSQDLAQGPVPAVMPDRGIHEAPASAAPHVEPAAVPVPVSLDVEEAFADLSNLAALSPLSSQESDAADSDWAARYTDVHPAPERIGLVRRTGSEIAAGLARATPLPDGRVLWTLAVRSLGACGLRLHLSDFEVADGEMLIFAPDLDGMIVLGPFTRSGPNGTGDFWSASLPGDTAFIEVTGLAAPQFRVTELVHLEFLSSENSAERARCGPFPTLDDCLIDVMCRDVDLVARQATGQMNFVVGTGCGVCTGTLLSDLDPATAVPYFLTANHCVSNQTEINSLEVVFDYQTAYCGDPTIPNWNANPASHVTGGTFLGGSDADGGDDSTFIRLSAAPANAQFAGWNTATSAGSYGIHHPAGSWKRVYFVSGVGVCPGCEFCQGDSDEFDFYDIDDGIEQGGSSGSGVFTSSGQLCGQLLGHCCLYPSCAGDSLDCDNRDEHVVTYGEFEESYAQYHRWLEIGGTVNVDRGYNGEEWGTPAQPFNTFNEGYNFAWNGSRVRLVGNNSYPASGVFTKQLTLLAGGGDVTIGQ